MTTTDAAARSAALEIEDRPACGATNGDRTCLRRQHTGQHQDMHGTWDQVSVSAPVAAPVAAPAPTVTAPTPTTIRYQLRPAGEPHLRGGYWVTRLGMGPMGAADGCIVPATGGNGFRAEHSVIVYKTALEAAAALTKAPLAAHEIAQGNTAAPLIAGRGRSTLQQRAQRVVGSVETEAQKAKREALERQRRAQAVIDGAITVALTAHDGEFPHGCLVAWVPLGTHSWQKIADVARAADVVEPARRTDRAIASAAVARLQADGYRVEVQTRGSCWNVYRPAKVTVVGQSVGDTALMVKLVDEQLVIEGPADMAATVRAAFDSAKAASQLDSTAISTWLTSILKSWRAVSICYGRWVPPGARTEAWLKLAGCMADAGLNVARRPAKVSSVEDVKEEVVLGLKCEVEGMVSKIAGRIEAGKALKAGHIGFEGASALQLEVGDLRSKVKMYEVVTGPLAGAHAELDRMDEELAPFVTDAAARSALVAQEVG